MPVQVMAPIRRLTQAEFGDLAYIVMGHVFELHREFGRFFDERIYKRELARRCSSVALEIPIVLTHQTYRAVQYIDVLAGDGAPFEFKSADDFVPRHSAQLLNYMLLADLSHGKLVNVGKDKVQHEFVNTSLEWQDRVQFEVRTNTWDESIPGARDFRERLVSLLRDWGTSLDVRLYEQAMTHFCGEECISELEIRSDGCLLGTQVFRLAGPTAAFAITAFQNDNSEFPTHVLRLLRPTKLESMLWANVSLDRVTFTAVKRA
jgi:GxxExxY protein